MDIQDTKVLKQLEPVEEVPRIDERLQAVLHAELTDFFMYYDLLNFRLRWFLDQYDFKTFDELKEYYHTYVLPRINEQKNEDKQNLSE